MSKNKNFLRCLFAFACLTAALSLTSCKEAVEEPVLLSQELVTDTQVNYKLAQVQKGSHIRSSSGIASVLYPLQAELALTKSNCHYLEILVKEKQEVTEGQILMTFAPEEKVAELESLKLQLKRLAEDKEAGILERQTFIAEEENRAIELTAYLESVPNASEHFEFFDLQISRLTLEKLQAEYEQFCYQCNHRISQLREAIESMEQDLADNALYAPFTGTIDHVADHQKGDLIKSGETLITMYATDKMLLAADDSAGMLRYNMKVTIEAGPARDRRSFGGTVVAAPNILPSSLSQKLAVIQPDVELTDKDLRGRINYQANSQELKDILVTVPSAVNMSEGRSFVYVTEGDTVQKRFVITGLGYTDTVWILDGLCEGQTLLID